MYDQFAITYLSFLAMVEVEREKLSWDGALEDIQNILFELCNEMINCGTDLFRKQFDGGFSFCPKHP